MKISLKFITSFIYRKENGERPARERRNDQQDVEKCQANLSIWKINLRRRSQIL